MITKLWLSTLEKTDCRKVPSSSKISLTASQERTLLLYLPATFARWVWMAEVKVFLSSIAETHGGNCECQTMKSVLGGWSGDRRDIPRICARTSMLCC